MTSSYTYQIKQTLYWGYYIYKSDGVTLERASPHFYRTADEATSAAKQVIKRLEKMDKSKIS